MPKDVVFTSKGTVGRVALVPDTLPEVVYSPQLCFWRVLDTRTIDPRFLFYWLLSPDGQSQLGTLKDQTDMAPYVSLRDQRSVSVPVPPPEVQSMIANTLGTLDNKIDLNRKMNVTLGRLLQAMVAKSWNDEPGNFDNRLLSEVADIIDCLHSKKPERSTEAGGILLQLDNIGEDGTLQLDDQYLISRSDYALWTSRMELSAGDCVITNVGRVGAVAQIPDEVFAAAGRNMTGMRARIGAISPTYLLESLLSPRLRDEIRLNTDVGTILDSLNVRNIGKLRIPVPRSSMAAIEATLRPCRALMETNVKENRKIAQLRDALLPALISGRMTVN